MGSPLQVLDTFCQRKALARVEGGKMEKTGLSLAPLAVATVIQLQQMALIPGHSNTLSPSPVPLLTLVPRSSS